MQPMSSTTPMMAQYKKVKEEYADCILMFRLGDFYEMFFSDAVEASKILGITLTARNKKGGVEGEIPMCGIPYHALDNYLGKLTRAGKKVALCDQVTAPNGKGIVEREVIRVITPGTTFDANIIEEKANNYLAAVKSLPDGRVDFAYSDITTGEFKNTVLSDPEELVAEIFRIQPAECIGDNFLVEKMKPLEGKIHFFAREIAGEENAEQMLLNYLRETQKNNLEHMNVAEQYKRLEFMPLDESCIRNLELFRCNHDGGKHGSLLGVLDETVSSMGGRMLRRWMLNPLLDCGEIKKRLENVEVFFQDSSLLRRFREYLNGVYDLERLISRLSLGIGSARDLVAMRHSLERIPLIKDLIAEKFVELNGKLDPLKELADFVSRAIVDEPPAITNNGGMIRGGFHQELDELRAISGQGKGFIADLQKREIERTGIGSLKVKFNKVFGYYIEISKSNLSSVPEDYIRKQTLVNAERFITPELKEYEEKVLTAEDRIKELEYQLFHEVRGKVVEHIREIQRNAEALATLDVFATFAYLACENNYCKPEVSENGNFEIKNGRHPVVEKISRDFVANDCEFNADRNFILITGPNMGGKSTYLRQVALIVLMAQIGSFVPAEKAEIALVDRIFTRVGAWDNLAKGQSTFMVEMNEAAFILSNATEKSLVILDELGRGTSTYDGVSIAWAVTEFLHDKIKAKTIFATHYHELIALIDDLQMAVNMCVAVRENEEEGVVFLYKVVPGGVDKSYGIEVAKLAGLPETVIARAQNVLKELESPHQMPMFTPEPQREQRPLGHEALEQLKNLDINKITPLQAMEELDKMKRLFEK